jgi:hypothetical protein
MAATRPAKAVAGLWLMISCKQCEGLLNLPANTSTVIMNIGSNIDPVLPPAQDFQTIAIAFGPIVGCRIKRRDRLYVVPAAVSATASFATMSVLNMNGLSSSLSAPATKNAAFMRGITEARPAPSVFVPVLSTRMLLEAIPPDVELWFLKTDMQGHDFEALAGGGELLKRVHYLRVECWASNVFSYEGVRNDFCNDHLPHMTALGFEFVETVGYRKAHRFKGIAAANAFCAQARVARKHFGIQDMDAFWKRQDTWLPPPPSHFLDPVMARRRSLMRQRASVARSSS